jgi:hypothetical protein
LTALRRFQIAMPDVGPAGVAAFGVFLIALVVYVQTLLPGSSFGDWGEMQMIPAQLGVPHPTGYPLYVLLGKAFSLLPIGSVAYRANLLSAVAAAGAAAAVVLVATRLGVRPVIAAIAGLTLAVTGTLWLEATFSEMNGLHLLLVGLVIHRALVWRAERRDSDLRLGGLLAGLSVANHLLAVTVVPIVVLFVLIDARRRLRERPVLLAQAALLFLAGVSLYLFIPLRALAGPPEVYGPLLTCDGVSSLISGAQFRGDMHFGSTESLGAAWRALPGVAAQFQSQANLAFLVLGLTGGAIQLVRDRWAALMLGLMALISVYVFANYLGDLDHYLLVAWFVLAVWMAVALETIVAAIAARLGPRAAAVEVVLVVLPIAILTSNWAIRDQSANRVGEEFAPALFAQLAPNAVLLTYWDALTNLSYAHCIEGQRPDLSLWAPDPTARVTCDRVTGPLEVVARQRPVYALFYVQGELDRLRGSFDLVPVGPVALPWGRRYPDQSGVLYRLQPKSVEGNGAAPPSSRIAMRAPEPGGARSGVARQAERPAW